MPQSPQEVAARVGMDLALAAREYPDRLAIISRYQDRTFAELNAQANQLARVLRARGLAAGDSVALICANRPEFAVAVYATLRAGMRLTPISCQSTADEAAFILDHCDARAVLVDASYAACALGAVRRVGTAARERLVARLSIGEPMPGFQEFEAALDAESAADLADPVLGSHLVYTSGTTGRPKGVHSEAQTMAERPGFAEVARHARYVSGKDLHLCTGPLYQQGNLLLSLMMPLSFGCGVVMMYRWSAPRALEMIDGYRVTHTHMVPSMLRHLVALPDDARSGYSLRSLRMLLHGAAPCPPGAKQSLLEWMGPVLYEYYAAAEGWGCLSTPDEWRERPGTVGRPEPASVEIRDHDGSAVPAGVVGTIHMRLDRSHGFSYHKDPELTAHTIAGDFVTLGDAGTLDGDGYLYVHDREADTIHRAGVSIYPAEVDAAIVTHPAVADAGTIGVPHAELGEEVLSVVVLHDGEIAGVRLAAEIAEFCRARLPQEKCPGRIEFAERLPRRETGKMLRRVLRDGYKERAVSLPISTD